MTRNGKIARLPKATREELNRRIDDNEEGKGLVVWLNARPEVQAVMTADFGGKPVTEQSLSEWKKAGFRDWLAAQERRESLRNWMEEAGELAPDLRNGAVMRYLSAMLAGELARAAREVIENTEDPAERAEALGALIGKFAQLRREENHAITSQIRQEEWDRELAKEAERKEAAAKPNPGAALRLQRLCLDLFSRGGEEPVKSANPAAISPVEMTPTGTAA
jgi:hypothetical protein